jgi:5-azacytidine-induced protein 1
MPLLPPPQLAELRSEQDAGQEGWRAAVAERARRDLAEREAALAARMARERDEQLQVGCPHG